MLALAWPRPGKREWGSPKKHESENPSPSLSPRLQAFYEVESETQRRVVKQEILHESSLLPSGDQIYHFNDFVSI